MIFRNEYYFLSNMYNCKMIVNGIEYSSAESAFQSFKTINMQERIKFASINGFDAKKLGRKITLRNDWDDIRIKVMLRVVQVKFKQNPKLAKLLLDTKNIELVEDNTWGDTYWGKVNGVGQNNLGKILMIIRKELRGGK